MKKSRFTVVLLGLMALTLPVQGVVITEMYTFNPAAPIPDGAGPVGLSLGTSGATAVSAITAIDSLAVALNISGHPTFGGFNGDLFATIGADTSGESAVLLNRTGRGEAGVPTVFAGYDDGGFDITIDDAGVTATPLGDVHVYQTLTAAPGSFAQLTGTFSSDGRLVDPNTVVTGDAQTATLALTIDGQGIDPTQDWTLFLADFATNAGDTPMVINSWTLFITGDAPSVGGGGVPEPGTLATLMAVVLTLPVVRRFRRRKAD